jgi:hypothetical protein
VGSAVGRNVGERVGGRVAAKADWNAVNVTRNATTTAMVPIKREALLTRCFLHSVKSFMRDVCLLQVVAGAAALDQQLC